VNGYKTSIPRTIFGLAAITMTVLTLDALVFLPAEIDISDARGTLSRVVTAASLGASTMAASSDFDSVREAASAAVARKTAKPANSQQG
jgi:hypothetical protein